MAYVGKEPVRGQNRELDDISGSFNGGNTAFTMQVGGLNTSPGSVNQVFISLGGVMQNPGTDFTVASSTITFTTPPANGLDFWGLIQGDAVDINTPADSSVSTTKIINNAVTGAKIAMGSDAQGDVLYYNGTDYARLAAGTSGHYLKTQGSGANPVWAASNDTLSQRNLIKNGAMAVNQRGTVTAISSGKYAGPDRFLTHIVNLGVWSSSQTSSATDLNTTGFQHSFKMQNTTADASPAAGGYAVLIYRLEGYDATSLRYGTASAKQTTLSFWCKANISGWTSGTKSFVAELQADGGASESGQLVTLASNDTWQKVELTYPGNTSTALNTTNSEALAINLWLDSGSTYTSGAVSSAWSNKANGDRAGGLTLGLGNNTANYFQITGVQFEVGTTATDFEHRSYGDELARCQRYYFQSDNFSTNCSQGPVWGSAYSTTELFAHVQYPQPMRAAPTWTVADNSGTEGGVHKIGSPDVTGVAVDRYGATSGCRITKTSAWTAGAPYLFTYRVEAEL